MIPFVVVWLLQDFAQVLLMGFCVVPDVFLLSMVMLVLLPNVKKERQIMLVWAAFLGGLFWDFRWTNLPGLTAAINGAFMGLSSYLWLKIPAQGRTPIFFAVLAFLSMFLSGLMHFVFWTVPSQVAVRQFLVQQLIGIPVVALMSLFFWKVSSRNA